jgi:tRNA dimethylallyltransferase
LQNGLAELPAADAELRANLDERGKLEGWDVLHAELAALDPAAAARLKPTDRQRIQRALEICLLSGETVSVLQAATVPVIEADYLNIGLLPSDRQELHARIADRLNAMMQSGFLEEVRALSERPEMQREAQAMSAVGYRQLWGCVAGDFDESVAFEKALVATRRLAKRQMTWLRSWRQLNTIDSATPNAGERIVTLVDQWLEDRATGGISR